MEQLILTRYFFRIIDLKISSSFFFFPSKLFTNLWTFLNWDWKRSKVNKKKTHKKKCLYKEFGGRLTAIRSYLPNAVWILWSAPVVVIRPCHEYYLMTIYTILRKMPFCISFYKKTNNVYSVVKPCVRFVFIFLYKLIFSKNNRINKKSEIKKFSTQFLLINYYIFL